MSIHLHIYESGSTNVEVIEVTEEILVDELLRQVLNDQHEQFDLFSEGGVEPHHRQQRICEAGIKQGDHLHCRPKHHEVRVHIDQKPYQSPNITNGFRLYQLGKVTTGHQLYREVKGNHEDEPIFCDGEVFELFEDEHFHSSEKQFTGYEVFVNTEKKIVYKRLLSFNEIVDIAFNPRPKGTDMEFTVLFRNAVGRRHKGTLAPNHSVKVKNGTIFDVTPTNRS